MNEEKAREYLDRRGQLITDALYVSVHGMHEMRRQAEYNGWSSIAKACQETIDSTYAAISELGQLREEK